MRDVLLAFLYIGAACLIGDAAIQIRLLVLRRRRRRLVREEVLRTQRARLAPHVRREPCAPGVSLRREDDGMGHRDAVIGRDVYGDERRARLERAQTETAGAANAGR